MTVRSKRRSALRISLFALACTAAPSAVIAGIIVAPALFVGAPTSHAPSATDTTGDRELERDLEGLWDRYGTRGAGEPVRFWYFHGDGHGLYRYGRGGLTNTHSFDYRVDDGQLHLRFRKSGDRHQTPVSIVVDAGGDRWLGFGDDPREPGARYRHERPPVGEWRDTAEHAAAGPRPPGGRMWIDYRPHATGGAGFHMYQFNDPGIDGRGIGWFHRGDFDDWSTEALHYRIDGNRIELSFDLADEQHTTGFTLRSEGERRWMTLREDPRDFWARHVYEDGGKSFGGSPAYDVILGLRR